MSEEKDIDIETIIKKMREMPWEFVKSAPKPICVVKINTQAYSSHDTSSLIRELSYILEQKMPDYHVFVIPNEDYESHHDAMEFNVFYEKDRHPIYHGELKKIIEDSMKPKDIQP